MNIIGKLLLYCGMMYAITFFVPGVNIDAFWPTAIIAGVVFYLINVVVKPVIKILTLPINLLTLGLFSIVINAVAFWFVGYLVAGFSVVGISAAIIGSIVASLGAWVIALLMDKD